MFSTVVHHLTVQKFEPVLEPVELVLQVQVRGSGKVVKEPDRTELRQPYEEASSLWHNHSHMSAFGQLWLRFSRYTEHYSGFLVHSIA